jgi:hypothetical protein
MARSLADGLAGSPVRMRIACLTWAYVSERAKGIEPLSTLIDQLGRSVVRELGCQERCSCWPAGVECS